MSVPEEVVPRLNELGKKIAWLPPGWNQIVIDLDKAILEISPNYKLTQCKEKFGTLSYYVSLGKTSDDILPETLSKVNELIDEATLLSSKTCDMCGEPGELHKQDYWIATRCSKHVGVYD